MENLSTEIILTYLLPFFGLFYLFFQTYTFIKWKDNYRKFALIPLIVTIPTIIITIYFLAEKSNLWPIVAIFIIPIAGVYLFILGLFRYFYSIKQWGKFALSLLAILCIALGIPTLMFLERSGFWLYIAIPIGLALAIRLIIYFYHKMRA